MTRCMFCMILLSLSPGAAISGQATIELRVTATIPPRPCRYPEVCDARVLTAASTRVTVENGVIRYTGSRPRVSRSKDLLTVTF